MTRLGRTGPDYIGGQALVYVLALIIPLALTGALVFNSFQISNEKTRLQNTVDAAVFSGAVAEARDLNFMAYTNRAMIANQVAIAQMVGLVSWSRWLDQVVFNFSVITSWVPYLNIGTRAMAQASDRMLRAVERIMPTAVTGLDLVIDVLAKAQQLHNRAMNGIMIETISGVVEANDPKVDTGLSVLNASLMANYVGQHENFTRLIDRDHIDDRRSVRREMYLKALSRMEEKREITMESRDGFSSDRTYTMWDANILNAFKWEFRRAGSTDLTGAGTHHRFGSWIAMDTFSLQTRVRNCGWANWDWCSWQETPIGWGAAKVSRAEEERGVRYDTRYHKRRENLGGSWDRNSWASSLANRERRARGYREVKQSRAGYGGLRSFMDLAVDGLLTEGPKIQLILAKPASALRTNEDVGFNVGDMSLENGAELPADRMAAMGAAAPYFARPDDLPSLARADGRREYGNAYNPYWQARLIPLSETERRTLQVAAARVNF